MYAEESGVQNAQRKTSQKKGEVEQDMAKWIEAVNVGVRTILKTGRVESIASQQDLKRCAQLLSEEAAPFQWDIRIYSKVREMRTIQQTIISQDDNVDLQDTSDDDEDVVPMYHVGEVYLIRLDHPPFWTFGR
jgi:hypothetical protein